MWMAVDPAVPLRSWLSLLAVEIVVSRIPFLPNRDFVLLGTGLKLAGALHLAQPLLAGMLLTISALDKLLNLLFFALFALVRPDRMEEQVDQEVLAGELPG
jgi:hypothetical protein